MKLPHMPSANTNARRKHKCSVCCILWGEHRAHKCTHGEHTGAPNPPLPWRRTHYSCGAHIIQPRVAACCEGKGRQLTQLLEGVSQGEFQSRWEVNSSFPAAEPGVGFPEQDSHGHLESASSSGSIVFHMVSKSMSGVFGLSS